MNPITTRDIKPFSVLVRETYTLVRQHVHVFALISVLPLVFIGAAESIWSTLDVPGFGFFAVCTLVVFGFLFAIAGLFFRVLYPIAIIRSIDEKNSQATVSSEVPNSTDTDPLIIYRNSFKFFWSYFLVSMTLVLVVVAGSFFLIIPGIIVSIYFGFSVFTYVFEGKRGLSALIASAWLVRGRLYEVFSRVFPAVISVVLLTLMISIISKAILIPLGFDATVAQFISSLAIAIFLMPLLYTFGYFLYRDMAIGVGSEIDLAFAKKAKIWIIILAVIAIIAIVSLPVFLTILVASGKLILT